MKLDDIKLTPRKKDLKVEKVKTYRDYLKESDYNESTKKYYMNRFITSKEWLSLRNHD